MHRRNFLYALVGAAGATVGASILSRAEAAQLDQLHRPDGAPDGDGARAARASGDGPASDRLPSNADIQEVQYRRRYYRGRYRRPAVRWRRPARRRVCVVRRNRWGRRVRVCTWR